MNTDDYPLNRTIQPFFVELKWDGDMRSLLYFGEYKVIAVQRLIEFGFQHGQADVQVTSITHWLENPIPSRLIMNTEGRAIRLFNNTQPLVIPNDLDLLLPRVCPCCTIMELPLALHSPL